MAGNQINYTYDAVSKHLTEVNSSDTTISYGYDGAELGHRLSSIQANGTAYHFLYDKWSNVQSVKIGENNTLVTNA